MMTGRGRDSADGTASLRTDGGTERDVATGHTASPDGARGATAGDTDPVGGVALYTVSGNRITPDGPWGRVNPQVAAFEAAGLRLGYLHGGDTALRRVRARPVDTGSDFEWVYAVHAAPTERQGVTTEGPEPSDIAARLTQEATRVGYELHPSSTDGLHVGRPTSDRDSLEQAKQALRAAGDDRPARFAVGDDGAAALAAAFVTLGDVDSAAVVAASGGTACDEFDVVLEARSDASGLEPLVAGTAPPEESVTEEPEDDSATERDDVSETDFAWMPTDRLTEKQRAVREAALAAARTADPAVEEADPEAEPVDGERTAETTIAEGSEPRETGRQSAISASPPSPEKAGTTEQLTERIRALPKAATDAVIVVVLTLMALVGLVLVASYFVPIPGLSATVAPLLG